MQPDQPNIPGFHDRITLASLRTMVAEHKPIAMLTCYDHPTARILSATGLHILLVGDSAATTVLGEDSTTAATLDFMVLITRAVRRGAPNPLVMADMPFASYPDIPTASHNARRFVQDAGADAVKLECDGRHLEIVRSLAASGIVVCAHLGLLPQRAIQHGGYKAQGRTADEADRIVRDAAALTAAGAELILLEAVPDEVRRRVIGAVNCPVLGCGDGASCHGHVVVLHDMLGFNARPPRFVDKLADLPAVIDQAARAYVQAVSSRQYPADRHAYQMKK